MSSGNRKLTSVSWNLSLPDDNPVYTLKKVMGELDFSGLLANCSDKGRTGHNPIILNYQLLRRLKKESFLTLETLFIDGTKMEVNANRYTFVWHGTLNYHLAGDVV